MAKTVPFYFCRYDVLIDEELLDEAGQLSLLSELQGQYYPHRRTTFTDEERDTVLMRPRSRDLDGYQMLTWSVGQRIGERVSVEYDPRQDELSLRSISDTGHRYSDFVAIPALCVLAVDDRVSENHLGGKHAISRLKSIVRSVDDADINISLTTSPSDVEKALHTWDLSEFSFVARPYNPHPHGDISKRLSDEFKKDGIGVYRATAKPVPGQAMHPAEDGHIEAVVELADAGYAQYAVKGTTPEGHEAQIKRPKFERDRTKDERRQTQPRELRVLVSTEEMRDDSLFDRVGKALVGFYGQ